MLVAVGIILTDTRVSSSRSLALHSPQKHLAVPRLGNHNNPVKKSLPPLQLQESLDISKKTYQKKDERHLHRPIRGRSGLTRSGRVPIKKPPQKHQSPRRISTASRYFLRKRARCAGGASGGGVRSEQSAVRGVGHSACMLERRAPLRRVLTSMHLALRRQRQDGPSCPVCGLIYPRILISCAAPVNNAHARAADGLRVWS